MFCLAVNIKAVKPSLFYLPISNATSNLTTSKFKFEPANIIAVIPSLSYIPASSNKREAILVYYSLYDYSLTYYFYCATNLINAV